MAYTKLGDYLHKRSINKSEVARKTGLNKTRVAELDTLEKAKPRADEIYLIALAIGVKPGELLEELYSDLQLKNLD